MKQQEFERKLVLLDRSEDRIELACAHAVGAYWDGCHKIYLAMDDRQAEIQEEYGYTRHPPTFELIQCWWDRSCGLRFVEAVFAREDDPNAGYVRVIEQFSDWREWGGPYYEPSDAAPSSYD